MFNLHIIQALHGDCLVVEYGTRTKRKYLLIDGGPHAVYTSHLRPTLQQIVDRRGKLELVVLTHVDADHVDGLNSLFAEIHSQRANDQPPLIGVDAVWMNSFEFEQTVGEGGEGRGVSPAAIAELARSAEMAGTEVGVITRSIADGITLRKTVTLLDIPLNAKFARDLVSLDTARDPQTLDNLTLRIIGPTTGNLERLRREWQEWLAARTRAMAVADVQAAVRLDQSVPNRSSIMFLAEADGRRALFTGDGRCDHIVQGLVKAGLMEKEGTLHVDLLKMPHHGSARNSSRKFFHQITAGTYVFCADGKNGNPDLATLIWLVEAVKAQGRQVQLLATSRTPALEQLQQEYPPAEYGYRLKVMKSTASAWKVPLAPAR